MLYEDLKLLPVHDVLKRVVTEGERLQKEAGKQLEAEATIEGKEVATSAYYLVAEPLARLQRRLEYTSEKLTKGRLLQTTHRFCYRAAIILDPSSELPAKIPNLFDVVDEVNKILNAAGLCAGRDCQLSACDCKKPWI